jgi:hypothetical protein
MCIVYHNNNNKNIFIHIPKTSGIHTRISIEQNPENKIIEIFWDTYDNLDFAHLPYSLMKHFVNKWDTYKYFTHTRNPYHRIISAFIFKTNRSNPNENKDTPDHFKNFVKNTLTTYYFNKTYYDSSIIHYYPQYLFLINDNDILEDHFVITKVEDKDKPKYYDLKLYYDKETIDIINNIYEKDFKYFNYEVIHTI